MRKYTTLTITKFNRKLNAAQHKTFFSSKKFHSHLNSKKGEKEENKEILFKIAIK